MVRFTARPIFLPEKGPHYLLDRTLIVLQSRFGRTGEYLCPSPIVQGVSKRALQIWKRIEIYTEDIHNVLNCQNVAKHTEFYLGLLWFNVTSIGNV